MNWHCDISIGDLHYLRSKLALFQGFNAIYLSSFLKATEEFHRNRQFRVCDEYFLTWAFLSPEQEVNYLSGKMNWIDSMDNGNSWIIEAYMPDKSLSAVRQLSNLCPNKIIRFRSGLDIRSLHLP